MLENRVGVWGSYTSTPLCNVLPIHNKVVPSSNISTYVRLQNRVHNPTWIMRSSPKFPVTCCFGLQRCCCISSCRRREENREGQEQAKTCRHDVRRAKKTSSECLPNLRSGRAWILRLPWSRSCLSHYCPLTLVLKTWSESLFYHHFVILKSVM
jgi:hypothetical protein